MPIITLKINIQFFLSFLVCVYISSLSFFLSFFLSLYISHKICIFSFFLPFCFSFFFSLFFFLSVFLSFPKSMSMCVFLSFFLSFFLSSSQTHNVSLFHSVLVCSYLSLHHYLCLLSFLPSFLRLFISRCSSRIDS